MPLVSVLLRRLAEQFVAPLAQSFHCSFTLTGFAGVPRASDAGVSGHHPTFKDCDAASWQTAKPRKKDSMLPTCRVSTRIDRDRIPRLEAFSLMEVFKRHPDGTDAAGWGIAAVSDDNLVQILCGPVMCDPRHPAFSGAAAELTGFAEAIRWVNFSSRRVNVCVSSTTPSTLLVSPLVSLTPEET